ncbi:MAG: PfkB family carbohydrate kinase [Chloroflexi bacterium]|nr:PfkB family carbohydrate kinase [Chloroflexota bacterium]
MSDTVVVVGSVNVDLVVSVPRLPGPGETVSGGSFAVHDGGKGANQAAAAALLGAPTFLVAAVGPDEHGARARAALVAGGVDLGRLATRDAPTGVAAILVAAGGENLIAVAPGANGLLDAGWVAESVAAIAGPGDVVLACLEISEAAVEAAVEAAGRAGSTFVLNPAPARPLAADVVGRCAVLTPNQHELALLGGPGPLLAAGAGAIVETRGAEGCVVHRPDRAPVAIAAYPVRPVDTTGAGDAFNGALAVRLAEGADLLDAARWAAAAAAMATRRLGARAGLADRAEVEALIAQLGPKAR